MIHNNKLKIVAAILALAIALGGCAAKPADPPKATVSMEPARTPVITKTPETPSPTPMAIESLAPAAIETPGATGGIPPDIEQFLLNYSYNDVEPFNILFTGSTSADMDGDGSMEAIELQGLDRRKSGEYEYFNGLKILIGDHELVLKADSGWNFGLTDSEPSGTILDLDKADGKKELLVETNNNLSEDDTEPAIKLLLITYPDSTPKVLAMLDHYPEATGTGYITNIRYSKKLEGGYSIAIQTYERYLPDTGFEEVKAETVKALSYTSIPPEEEEGYPTSWDQEIAEEPGDDPDVTIKKGTAVYFGLYHTDGWIELHDKAGTTLGWLDLNNVDVDQYIGYALQVSCH